MKLVIATDEKTDLTDKAIAFLKEQGHDLMLLGHLIDENKKWQWADIGKEAAKKVASNEADFGVLFCWSGTGICIAANKINGARAALCWNKDIAELARKWDDANIICMSLKETKSDDAIEMLKTWFKTKFDEEDLKSGTHRRPLDGIAVATAIHTALQSISTID
jgi:ribose 5-phosphate isomerase B